jgi:hypothetical protein
VIQTKQKRAVNHAIIVGRRRNLASRWQRYRHQSHAAAIYCLLLTLNILPDATPLFSSPPTFPNLVWRTGVRDSVTAEITSTATGLEAPGHANPSLLAPHSRGRTRGVSIHCSTLRLTGPYTHGLHLYDWPHAAGHWHVTNFGNAHREVCSYSGVSTCRRVHKLLYVLCHWRQAESVLL